MSRLFTLQQNEDIYFKHSSTNEKNGSWGVLYITSLRLVWISNDKHISDYIITWSQILTDQYKTGKGKSKDCAIRLTLIDSDIPKEFYFGEATSEIQLEIENLRAAVKKARQSFQPNIKLGTSTSTTSTTTTNTVRNTPISATSTTTSSTTTNSNLTSSTTTTTTIGRQSKSKQVISRIGDHHQDQKRKQSLLDADNSLRKEYNELVGSGIINSEEFWSTRTHLLLKQECSDLLSNKGMSSSLLIEKADFKNNKTIQINAEVIQEIFTINPIVQTVYEKKVPHEMTEGEFWTQYFLSEYFTRDKAHLQSKSGHGYGNSYQIETDDMFSREENERKISIKQ